MASRLRYWGPGEEPEGQDGEFARSWELWTVCEQGNDITGAPSPQESVGSSEQLPSNAVDSSAEASRLSFGYCSPFPWHQTSASLLWPAGIFSWPCVPCFSSSHGFLTCSQVVREALGGNTASKLSKLSFFQQTFLPPLPVQALSGGKQANYGVKPS